MADGTIQLTTEGSGKLVDNSRFLAASSSDDAFRQRVTIGGDASSGALIDPATTAPSSAVYGLPVRLAMNSTANTIGSVAVSNNVNVSLLTSPISIQTNGGSPDSLPATVYSSSASALNVFLSTGQNTSGIDPRIVTPSSQWTVTAALAAASTISVAPTTQWTVTAALAAGSTASVAPTSQWTVTASLSAASTISVAPTTQWDVRIVGAGSSGVTGTVLVATGLTGAAIDPRQISAGSTLDVRVIGAGSSAAIGSVLITTGLGGAAIDPRAASLTASSSQTFPIQMSTAPDAAYIDPRILSTGGATVTRDKFGITANRTMRNFYSTGFAPPTASTMIAAHQVSGLTSGSSGFSFQVTAGLNYQINWFTASLSGTTANSGWMDVAIRADASTSGTTGTDVPVLGPFRILSSVGGATTILGQGAGILGLSGVDVVLPSDASFGISAVASSSTLLASVAFGGYEFVP